MTKHWWQQKETQGFMTWWRTQRRGSRLNAWLLQTLAQQGPGVTARFTTYYTQLRALPRRMRRALGRRWACSLASLALLLALGQGYAGAATINVGGGNVAVLIQAINDANSMPGTDTIVLDGSTFTLTDNIIPTPTLGPACLPVVSSKIVIQGNNSTITRSGVFSCRIFTVDTIGNLTLQDTTVSRGQILRGSTKLIRNGAGVLNDGGNVTLINSTISDNHAVYGGGVYNNTGGTLTVMNSTISGSRCEDVANNYSSEGCGVFNKGSLIVTGSNISDNRASGGFANLGGGVLNDLGASATLTNSTLSDNRAGYGGGVLNYGALTLIHTTISNNRAVRGGGVNTIDATLTLERSLIAGNIVNINGPEILQTFGGTVNVDNFNLFGVNGNAGVVGFTPGATDIVPAAGVLLSAILTPLALNAPGTTETHALPVGSPAIDAVTDGSCPPPTTDQRGVMRPQDGDGDTIAVCDIGSYEFDQPVSPCTNATPTNGCQVNGKKDQPCIGTASDDTILGTNGDDVIVGLAGNDFLRGREGNDLLCGGAGDDTLIGSGGADMLFGEEGHDLLRGNAGNNFLDGGEGNDHLIGYSQDDLLLGGPGDDTLTGGQGTDDLDGGPGADKLDGGGGTDMCTTDGDDVSVLRCEL